MQDEFISDYYNYSILNYENDAIMLSIGPLLKRVQASYTFEDDCIYLRDASQDYREYFCNEQEKQSQAQLEQNNTQQLIAGR
ncbi:hypothetical protein [Parendozoicomonas sp. Alg238-R29]|uniref:hypothetical protein n=1 Tax=Parendozoicomonas sp. Alg238-R29 TaxID=2993446 RepID=UPI00248F42F7|nr:hypothetical protein [Parendozoicomonas sp. Alg238-R29]